MRNRQPAIEGKNLGIKAGLSKPERVAIEGKGADVPIASNKTLAGRAQNRRVDIVVPREP